MEFLSLNEAPAPHAPRVTRSEAIGLSLVAHLLLFLLLFEGDRVLPESMRQWLAAREAEAVAAREVTQVPPVTQPAAVPAPVPPESHKMPVKFAYVKVPDDISTKKNPLAPLLSDKDRKARQEEPTPADARRLGADPHSKGDTIDRVRPDPTVPEGPDADHPIGRENPKDPEKDQRTLVEGPDKGEGRGPGAPGTGAGKPAETGEEATIVHGELVPPPGATGEIVPPRGSETAAGRSPTAGNEQPGSGGGTRSTPDLKPGTEYKFQFNNPGWLKDRAYGTMSFDTQGFPWGDYARKLYVAIRNRWLERIPLAARENMAGYTCQHFVIARDGTVTAIDVMHASRIPPFTKAATDAINAASRVPPLPEDFPKDSEGVTYCFYYNMYPGEAE